MPAGTIQPSKTIAMPGLIPRSTKSSMLGFVPGKQRRDLGYIKQTSQFRGFLWNGGKTDLLFTSLGALDADGIEVDTVAIPSTVKTGTLVEMVFSVTLDGPIDVLAVFDFNSTGEDPILTITATRAPVISGAIANIFFPHNWDQGFNEFLRWKTDVLIAHDRTEQRIKLRSRPRREWSLHYFESGAPRRLLENYLAGKTMRYYLVPVWYDARPIPTALPVGGDSIAIRTKEFEFHLDRPVAVFDGWDNYEIKTIKTMSDDLITFNEPCIKEWPTGSLVAPLRYCRIIDSKRVNRFTADAASYEVTAEALGETLPELRTTPELYETYPVCPFPAGWRDNANDLIGNKWVRLDNDTGVVQFDIQSDEPVFQRAAYFLVSGRAEILEFSKFLAEQSGRLAPFWLTSDAREFELAFPVLAGDTSFTIHNIDYARSLAGSRARSYVEFAKKDGALIRRKIVGVTTLAGDLEKLDVDLAFSEGFADDDLDQIAWNELVRFNADDIELNWFTDETVETTIPVVALP